MRYAIGVDLGGPNIRAALVNEEGDTVREMYNAMNIFDFMKESYAYCQRHEVEIRRQIG